MIDAYDTPGARDGDVVPGFENYEIRFFAEMNGMSIERARELIETGGRSRAEQEAAALRTKF